MSAWLAIFTLLLSLVGTGLLRKLALRVGLIDVPNSRSMHAVATPRGGGLAAVVASVAALGILWSAGAVSSSVVLALAGGIPVAVIGFVDDRRPVSPWLRLLVHFSAAVWALAWLGGVPALQVGAWLVGPHWVLNLLGVLAIVWVLNLFNFMDGIDGIAASEAAFMGCAGALLAATLMDATGIVACSVAMAMASFGFLVWNWPPARIFMGDVGSGFLGFWVAVISVESAWHHPSALLAWLILGSLFFADSTVTLARRLLAGHRPYEAHRTHAYQILARRWGGHLPVTLASIAVNLVWPLPLAAGALVWPGAAIGLLALAVLPLAGLAWVVGAGRPEQCAID